MSLAQIGITQCNGCLALGLIASIPPMITLPSWAALSSSSRKAILQRLTGFSSGKLEVSMMSGLGHDP